MFPKKFGQFRNFKNMGKSGVVVPDLVEKVIANII